MHGESVDRDEYGTRTHLQESRHLVQGGGGTAPEDHP